MVELTKEERDYIASQEIALCPFCGAFPVIEKTYVYKIEYVMTCPRCGSVIMKSHSLPDLIAKWNRRYYSANQDVVIIKKSEISLLISSLNELLDPAKEHLRKSENILSDVVKWLKEVKHE